MSSIDISALDRAFARMLVRRVSPAGAAARPAAESLSALSSDARTSNALLYATALLVSAERAQGNSCVELGQWTGRAFIDDDRDDQPPLIFPPLAPWIRALAVSGACDIVESPMGASVSPSPAASQRLTIDVAPLVLDGTRLYLRRYYMAEQRLARTIRRMLDANNRQSNGAHNPQHHGLDEVLPASAADGQRAAAEAALRSPLVFITGGPGTGKTTIAARLLRLLLDATAPWRIALAAPTGRAAARLAESLGQSSGSTLHRLLGYRPWDDRFTHTADNPIPADVIVVDEASMVDVLLMDALFAAIHPGTRVIVLGDPDQLASVDTGFVLGDIVRAAAMASAPESLREAVVRLTVSYRFGAAPGIGALASAAREGDATAFIDALEQPSHTDIGWRARTGIRHAAIGTLLEPLRSSIEAYLATTTPASALAALGTFRVLAALRESDAGVVQLNARIEQWIRRQGQGSTGFAAPALIGVGDHATWYDHRPVLITQNDPATQLFNGDVGVTLMGPDGPTIYFSGPDGPRGIAPARLPAHETAWAMTVHKAQGSEFDHVLLILPDGDARLLTRELLYTGITRAKRSVTVAGAEAVLRSMLERSVARSSGLAAALQQPNPTTA